MGTLPEQLRYHAERSAAAGRHASAIICREVAEEIEGLREILFALEVMTATGDGVRPEATIEVHVIAAEGRTHEPVAWRARPEAIARLRAAIRT